MYEETIFIAMAVIGGGIPPLIWLWFWLKEDSARPEPKFIVIATFVGGMLMVPLAFYLEKFAVTTFNLEESLLASGGPLFQAFFAIVVIEESLKYGAAKIIAFQNKNYDEPVDAVIYLISAALGFATIENILFLIGNAGELPVFMLGGIPFEKLNEVVINQNLRFIGANTLHVVTSGILGIFIGLAFYKSRRVRALYLIAGLLTAVLLHTLFNFSILTYSENPISVFAVSWIATLVLILLFEKVKRVRSPSDMTSVGVR